MYICYQGLYSSYLLLDYDDFTEIFNFLFTFKMEECISLVDENFNFCIEGIF
jgi:hypothetical protein